jgi:uncharacterized alkaline shock family protein YloU
VEAAPHPLSSPLGRISIASDVVAAIVGHTAAECYGVVGMSAPSRVGRATRRLSRDRPTRGVVVRREDGGVAIELYVVVEYGLNLAEVASTIRNRVGYEVERLTGLSVSAVEVHIQDVRRPPE